MRDTYMPLLAGARYVRTPTYRVGICEHSEADTGAPDLDDACRSMAAE